MIRCSQIYCSRPSWRSRFTTTCVVQSKGGNAVEAILNLVPPLTEGDLAEAEQFAAGCDLAPNAATRIKRLAVAYRQLSVACDCLAAELESVNKALEPLGGYLLESREKTIERAARITDDIHKLVAYACTVQRNSVLGGEPFVVVDVDGDVICTGPSVYAAMHWAVYKIETGEDVPEGQE